MRQLTFTQLSSVKMNPKMLQRYKKIEDELCKLENITIESFDATMDDDEKRATYKKYDKIVYGVRLLQKTFPWPFQFQDELTTSIKWDDTIPGMEFHPEMYAFADLYKRTQICYERLRLELDRWIHDAYDD